MSQITDIPGAIAAIDDFRANLPASTPDALRDEIAAAAVEFSPVDKIVRTAEAMYAHKDDLTKGGRKLVVGLAALAATYGWHGLAGEDQRGLKIVKAMRRDIGEEAPAGDWPQPDEDPEPLSRYATGAQPAAIAPAPVPPAEAAQP